MKKLPLSHEEKKRRRRLRAAELRAKKKADFARRSRAAKKGWESRKIARLEKENAQLRLALAIQKKQTEVERFIRLTLAGKAEEALGPEEYKAAIAEMSELHFREYTPEEKANVLGSYWREVETIIPKQGQSLRQAYMQWAQRNGFSEKDFWAEYRRRKGQ